MGYRQDCPCTKDCPKRDYKYCRICPEGNSYREKTIIECESRETERNFEGYVAYMRDRYIKEMNRHRRK